MTSPDYQNTTKKLETGDSKLETLFILLSFNFQLNLYNNSMNNQHDTKRLDQL